MLDAFRKQLAFPDLVDQVLSDHRRWRADALIIEGASIGHSLHAQVKKFRLPGILRCPSPRLSKQDRLAACTPQLQSGAFLLPSSAEWLPDFRRELLAFPDGRNDDHVDALTQFVEFAFAQNRWVQSEYDNEGRRIRVDRPTRRPRFYDGDVPSGESWSDR
jgi:predicted phage terminase large subunit-like protein